MNVCLSDLRIDMWLAGDLGAREQADARAHADGCAACAARVARIEAARAATVPDDLEAIRRAAAARRAPRSRGEWYRLCSQVGLLASAAAFLILGRPAGDPDAGARRKGPAHIGLYVKHGEAVRRGGPGEEVSPGDGVRFTASSARPAHLAIIGVDAAGTATVYFPTEGAPDMVPAGDDVELPRATVLDDTLGLETVHAFFCADAVDRAVLERLRTALRWHPDGALVLTGCTADRIFLRKVPSP